MGYKKGSVQKLPLEGAGLLVPEGECLTAAVDLVLSVSARSDFLDTCFRTTLLTSGDPAAPATLNLFTVSATLPVFLGLGGRDHSEDHMTQVTELQAQL